MRCRNVIEARSLLKHGCGFAETAAAPFWRELSVPNLVRVVVKRPLDEIVESFRTAIDDNGSTDWSKLRSVIAESQLHLDCISKEPDTLTVKFHELNNEDVCAEIFSRCLGRSLNKKWFQEMNAKNIEVNVGEFLRHSDGGMMQCR